MNDQNQNQPVIIPFNIIEQAGVIHIQAGAQLIIGPAVHINPNVQIVIDQGGQFLQILNDGAVVPFLGDNNDGE
jgi:hypothetical protein